MKKIIIILFPVAVLKTFVSKTEEINLIKITKENVAAISFVANFNVQNGMMQLDLLLCEGLKKDSFVLEIGCGALVAGIPIMSYLERSHYVGIDPNKWLIHKTLNVSENAIIVQKSQPVFLYNENFDASSLGIEFDYIISHSIISHAAHWQLALFLKNCARALKLGGKVIFSCRLTEPNSYGNKGSSHETKSSKWVYPGVSFFHKQTIINEAAKYFSLVEHKPEYTELVTNTDKTAYHDWFVLTK